MIAPQVLNEWYPVAMASQIRAGQGRQTQLLGEPIAVALTDGAITVQGALRSFPVIERYGHVWTCPGTPRP